jgi:hypothetical protein
VRPGLPAAIRLGLSRDLRPSGALVDDSIAGVSARSNLRMTHLDFKSPFLQGELDVPLFMELPEGWRDNLVEMFKAQQGKVLRSTDVLRLKRGIYGLKQAGRIRYVAMSRDGFSTPGSASQRPNSSIIVQQGMY